jgi:outer membrane protein assembly factor BamA
LYSHIKRKVAKNVFVGLLFDYQNIFKIDYSPGGNFDTVNFFGKKPYTVSGFGASIGYDTRNSAFWPTKGIFIQSFFNAYTKTTGSYYDFYKWIVDVRYFKQLFKGHVLATQLYSYTTFGETPLRNLANLGGDGNLRGFYRGRFRDNNMLTLITEYRAHIIWRLSACAFAGIGNVYNDFSDLQKNDLKYSFGGGLRLSLLEKEKLNIRVDYGYYDKYNSGFYFTIGECF